MLFALALATLQTVLVKLSLPSKALSVGFKSVNQMFLERGFNNETNKNIFISQIMVANMYKFCNLLCLHMIAAK